MRAPPMRISSLFVAAVFIACGTTPRASFEDQSPTDPAPKTKDDAGPSGFSTVDASPGDSACSIRA